MFASCHQGWDKYSDKMEQEVQQEMQQQQEAQENSKKKPFLLQLVNCSVMY